MNKKAVIVIVAGIVLIAFAAFLMGQRRSHMMGGGGMGSGTGTSISLAAVSADGETIPLAADVKTVTGNLADGTSAQKIGDMIVIFSMNPYPATMRQPTGFSVTLTDAEGNAINDATVNLDLTMPEMYMPPNKPALEFVADGKYSATGQFTMRGWWRIEVIITRGGQTESAFFDVSL